MCREFEQILAKRRAEPDSIEAGIVDLHMRTCPACRAVYDRLLMDNGHVPADLDRVIAMSSTRTARASRPLLVGLVSAASVVGAFTAIQMLSSRQATAVIEIPKVTQQVRTTIGSAVEQTLRPSPPEAATTPPAKVPEAPAPAPAPRKKAARRMATTSVLVSRSKPVWSAPRAHTIAPTVSAIPVERQRPLETVKFALIHNAGPQPLPVLVTKPEFVSEPLAGQSPAPTPRFAVISGAGPDPVLIEVLPYEAHGSRLASAPKQLARREEEE